MTAYATMLSAPAAALAPGTDARANRVVEPEPNYSLVGRGWGWGWQLADTAREQQRPPSPALPQRKSGCPTCANKSRPGQARGARGREQTAVAAPTALSPSSLSQF
jgi:hypothetical protein